MEVKLTSEQETYLSRLAASTGRNPEQALQEAVADWVERQAALADFRATLDDAEAAIAAGAGIEITPAAMQALAEDVKRRGRERVAARRGASA